MKPLVLIIIFLSCSLRVQAQQPTMPETAVSINFKIKNFGIYVNGSFADITIHSSVNTNNLKDSFINATIKVNSLTTHNAKRDKHLFKEDFFDVGKYEKIRLLSTSIEKVSANQYKLHARLTIKKTTREIVIPLQITEAKHTTTITSKFSINRRNYEVGANSWVLSDIVKIKVVYTIKK